MATSPAAREAVLLQAIYSFKGSHNDEVLKLLCISRILHSV